MPSSPYVKTYSGGLPTGSGTFSLINTATEGIDIVAEGMRQLEIDISHDENFTLKAYWSVSSDDTGWVQFDERPAPAPGAGSTTYGQWLVAGKRQVKLEAVNGGTDQTTFEGTISLDSRS
ncbi:MAG: hypothetical protein B7733_05950 [Myxococcales bacterium FL481]|nr:MAG: hypothetical protein B7733_05950 [Myxococcales bacterium FL481]